MKTNDDEDEKEEKPFSYVDPAYKTTKAEAKALAKLVAEFEDLRSPEYIQDLYSVFKYGGRAVKSDNEIAKEARTIYTKGGGRYFWEVKRELLQKKLFLENFSKHPIFKAFRKLPPLKATEKLLRVLRATAQQFQKMAQQAQNFPAVRGRNGSNPMIGHTGGGPAPKTYDFSNIMLWGMFLFDYRSKQWNGQGAGGVPYFDTQEQADNFVQEVIDMAERLRTQDLLVFRLAQVLEMGIMSGSEKKVTKVDEANNQMTVSNMEQIKDVVKASPVEMAQDEDLLNKKIVERELQVRKFEETKTKKQLLHVMLDVSGSMRSVMWDPLVRGDISRAIIMAMLSRVVNKGDKMYLRPYSGAPGQLFKAFDTDQVRVVAQKVRDWQFDGGSTDTESAIEQAILDIQGTVDKDIDKAEILVITDGTDMVDVDRLNKMKDKIKIHFLLVTEENVSQHVKDNFKGIADQFLQITRNSGAEDIVPVLV